MPRSKLLRQVTEERGPDPDTPDDAAAEDESTVQVGISTLEHSDASASMHTDAPTSPEKTPKEADAQPQPATHPEPAGQPLAASTTPPVAPEPQGPQRGRQRPALSATWSRTTVLIEPSVFRRLRFQAVTEDRTFSEIITDALRQYLDKAEA
jgi:hypothetical protein